jgi:hypothetical protein
LGLFHLGDEEIKTWPFPHADLFCPTMVSLQRNIIKVRSTGKLGSIYMSLKMEWEIFRCYWLGEGGGWARCLGRRHCGWGGWRDG